MTWLLFFLVLYFNNDGLHFSLLLLLFYDYSCLLRITALLAISVSFCEQFLIENKMENEEAMRCLGERKEIITKKGETGG